MADKLTDVNYDEIKIDMVKYKAILFIIDGRDVWLARSLIEVDKDNKTITMPEWVAIEKELV